MSINSVLHRWKALYDEIIKDHKYKNKENFGLKPLLMDSHNRIYIAENIDKEMSVYIEFADDAVMKTYTFPSLKGISISHKKDIVQKGSYYLKIAREKDCPDEVFISLSISLADGIEDTDTDLKTLIVLDDVLKQYSHLFTKKKNSLGREKEQGLYCELRYLEELINNNGDSVISMWAGPEKNKHDFVISDKNSVEIKSTNNEEQLIIHISNENQLSNEGLDELKLVVYVVEINNVGETVNDIITRILQRINNADMFLQFLTDLALIGIDPELYKGEYSFVISKKYTFVVEEDFPKISKSDISPKVFDVKYRLNLSDESPLLED